jgi:hypothetical protein
MSVLRGKADIDQPLRKSFLTQTGHWREVTDLRDRFK